MTWNAEAVSSEGINENLHPYGVPLIKSNYLLMIKKYTVSLEWLFNPNFSETLNYLQSKEMKI